MMSVVYGFYRLVRKIKWWYYAAVFKEATGNRAVEHLKVDGEVEIKASNVKIGNHVHIYKNVVFWGDGEIVIGDHVDIGNNTIIFASKDGGVHIGNDVNIAANCYIIDSDHGIKKDGKINEQPLSSGKIEIGNDVWLAANVTVLKGSHIADGAVIGAKGLVKGEIPPNSIAVGVPAKVIKERK